MIYVNAIPFDYVKFPDGTCDTNLKDEAIDEIIWQYDGDMAELIVCLSLLTYNTVNKMFFIFLPYARQDKKAGFGGLYSLLDIFRKFENTTSFSVLDIHNAKSLPKSWRNRLVQVYVASEKETSVILFPDENAWNKYYEIYWNFETNHAVKNRDPLTGEIISISLYEPIKESITDIHVVDDICDGGKTFIELAKICPPWANLHLHTTYGIYSKGRQVILDAGYALIHCQHNILGNM